MNTKIFTDEAINQRRKRLSQHMNSVLKDNEYIVIHCGSAIQIPGGLDQHYSFYPHPDYYWITGNRRDQGVCTYSKSEGWTDFVKPVTDSERLWESVVEPPPGQDIKTLEAWLSKRATSSTFVHIGRAAQQHAGLYNTPKKSDDRTLEIQELWNQVRRIKDSEEVEWIKRSASAAKFGFQKIQSLLNNQMTERQVQIEYEAEVYRRGAHNMPYSCIIGSGVNAATLHALPTDKVIQPNDLVLVDAGAAHHDYCVDITRTFHDKKNSQHTSIYNIVKSAQEKSIAACKPGVLWSDIHKTAATEMARGLNQLGILNESAEEAVESQSIGAFFPHGVGHLMGLKVRDVGGDPRKSPHQVAGARVRFQLPLENNFIVTVEPGLYFVKALMESKTIREKYKTKINWTEVEKWKGFGGVRLEDDILIRNENPVILTKDIPK